MLVQEDSTYNKILHVYLYKVAKSAMGMCFERDLLVDFKTQEIILIT